MIKHSTCVIMLLLCLSVSNTNAQPSLMKDSSLRVGTLPNGFKYFLLQTNDPGLSIRLTVKGGFFQETREQAHLSHVIEHMAFTNKSIDPNRADKSVLDDLGIDPSNINGITDFQRTSYRVNIAEVDTAKVYSTLAIFRAWCNQISMDSAHVNLDRTSVLNELISLSGGSERASWASLYTSEAPHKFSELIPHVRSVDYRVAGELYRSMYQPDRQALFIAGNWKTVPDLEKRLRVLFSSLPAATVAKHPRAKVTPVKGTFWELQNETNHPLFKSEYKLPAQPVTNSASLKLRLIAELVAELGAARLSYLKELNSQILSLEFKYTRTPMAEDVLAVFEAGIYMDQNITKNTYDTLLADYLTMEKLFLAGNFSKQEISDAKEKIGKKYARLIYADHPEWAIALEDSYIENESFLGPAVINTLVPSIINSITLKDLQQMVRQLRLTKDVSYIFGHTDSTEKFALSKEQFFSRKDKINKSTDLAVRPAIKKNLPVFLTDSLQNLQVTKRERVNGASVLTLSNGNRVLLKTLPSKNEASDYVEVDVVTPGGLSLLTESEKQFAQRLHSAMEHSVQHGISKEEFAWMKNKWGLRVDASWNKDHAVITGNATPDGTDLLLKMIIDRLYYAPLDRRGVVLSAAEATTTGEKRSALDSLVSLTLLGDPAINLARGADVPSELRELENIYQKLFPPRNAYTMIITGQFDTAKVEKLLLGRFGLSSSQQQDTKAVPPADVTLPFGSTQLSQMIQTGKRRGVNLWFYTKIAPNLETGAKLKLLGSIFDSYLFNRIRNELGEVYGISAMVHQSSDSIYALYVSAPTETVTPGHLYNSLDDAIQKFLAEGINESTLNTAKEKVARRIELAQNDRRFWNKYFIEDVLKQGKAPGLAQWIQAVQSVQVDELRNLARQFLVANMEFIDDQPN